MTGYLFNQGRQLEKGNANDIQISPSLKMQAGSKGIRQALAWPGTVCLVKQMAQCRPVWWRKEPSRQTLNHLGTN